MTPALYPALFKVEAISISDLVVNGNFTPKASMIFLNVFLLEAVASFEELASKRSSIGSFMCLLSLNLRAARKAPLKFALRSPAPRASLLRQGSSLLRLGFLLVLLMTPSSSSTKSPGCSVGLRFGLLLHHSHAGLMRDFNGEKLFPLVSSSFCTVSVCFRCASFNALSISASSKDASDSESRISSTSLSSFSWLVYSSSSVSLCPFFSDSAFSSADSDLLLLLTFSSGWDSLVLTLPGILPASIRLVSGVPSASPARWWNPSVVATGSAVGSASAASGNSRNSACTAAPPVPAALASPRSKAIAPPGRATWVRGALWVLWPGPPFWAFCCSHRLWVSTHENLPFFFLKQKQQQHRLTFDGGRDCSPFSFRTFRSLHRFPCGCDAGCTAFLSPQWWFHHRGRQPVELSRPARDRVDLNPMQSGRHPFLLPFTGPWQEVGLHVGLTWYVKCGDFLPPTWCPTRLRWNSWPDWKLLPTTSG